MADRGSRAEVLNARLRVVLQMDHETIAANEQGRFSESQRNAMLSTLKGGIIIIAVCSLFAGYFVFRLSDNVRQPLWLVFLTACVLLIVATHYSLRGFRDLINGHVNVYEGVLRRIGIDNPMTQAGKEIHYVVGKLRINIPDSVVDDIEFGLPYRLYCAAGTNTLIGAQVLSDLPPNTNGA